jgi:hypothetical protein
MAPESPTASPSALQPPNADSTSSNPPPHVAHQTASSEGPDGSGYPPTANDDHSKNPAASTSIISSPNHESPPNSTSLNAGIAEGEQDTQRTSNPEQPLPPYVDQAKIRAKNTGKRGKKKQDEVVPLVEATSTEATVVGPTPTDATSTEATAVVPMPTEATSTEATVVGPTLAETLPPKNKGNQRGATKRKAEEAALEPRDGARRSTRLRSGPHTQQ